MENLVVSPAFTYAVDGVANLYLVRCDCLRNELDPDTLMFHRFFPGDIILLTDGSFDRTLNQIQGDYSLKSFGYNEDTTTSPISWNSWDGDPFEEPFNFEKNGDVIYVVDGMTNFPSVSISSSMAPSSGVVTFPEYQNTNISMNHHMLFSPNVITTTDTVYVKVAYGFLYENPIDVSKDLTNGNDSGITIVFYDKGFTIQTGRVEIYLADQLVKTFTANFSFSSLFDNESIVKISGEVNSSGIDLNLNLGSNNLPLLYNFTEEANVGHYNGVYVKNTDSDHGSSNHLIKVNIT